MGYDGKAFESLEAAERLLPSDDHDDATALANACASRAYYAAYHAVAHRALQRRAAFTSTRHGYFRHDTLPDDAAAWGVLDVPQRAKLILLRSARIKADYDPEDLVDLEEATLAVDNARSLVKDLLGQESSP